MLLFGMAPAGQRSASPCEPAAALPCLLFQIASTHTAAPLLFQVDIGPSGGLCVPRGAPHPHLALFQVGRHPLSLSPLLTQLPPRQK